MAVRVSSAGPTSLLEPRVASVMSPPPVETAEEAAPPEKPRIHLQVACATPSVLSCDTTKAHLSWEQPSYVSAPKDTALPALSAESFQILWAQVPLGTSEEASQLLDWQPLPSGNVQAPEVQVGGLKPGRRYAVCVNVTVDTSQIDKDKWDVSCQRSPARVFSTQPTRPSAIKPPLLVAKDRKSLKVKWNEPEETGGESMNITYQLFMSPPPQGWSGRVDAQGCVEVYQGPERSFKVLKLIPGARYNFWVMARNAIGPSDPGSVATYTTQATVPGQPDAPRPVSCTQSSITFQWVAPPSNGAAVSNYTLERDEGGTLAAQMNGLVQNSYMRAYAGPLQTVMVGGLKSGMHYRFRLRAENDEGSSFWSEPILATPAASPPGVPSQVVTSSITQQSATVAWLAPADDGGAPVTGHEVEIQAVSRAAAESMGPDWLKIFEGSIMACTISSLQPGCTYRLRVRCANQAGFGNWCMPIDLLTAPDVPGAPGAPVIQQSGTTSLTLTWQPPRHNGGQRISAFLVDMLPQTPNSYNGPVLPRVLPARQSSGNHPHPPPPPPPPRSSSPQVPNTSEVLVYRGEDTTAQILGLQPGVMYKFRVQACNALGGGPWSEWSILGTAPDVPSGMMPPCLAAPPTSNLLRVSWQAPDAGGSAITAYVLQAAVQGRMTSGGQLIPHSASAVDLSAALQHQQGAGSADGTPLPAAEATQAPIAPQHAGLLAGPWQQVYKGLAMQADMPALQPCTRYLLRVAAQNVVGTGGWSPVTALTTAPAPPRAPASIAACADSSSAMTVTWQPPTTDNGSPVTGYTLDMAPSNSRAGANGVAASSWQQVATTTGSECTSAPVSGLLPGRSYLFRVRATNACGTSPPCVIAAPATTLPAAPSAPLRLMLTQRGATQAKARWEEPAEINGAPVCEYLLEVALADQAAAQSGSAAKPTAASEQGEDANGEASHADETAAPQGEVVWRQVYCGPETTARVGDLLPGTRYVLRVSASNGVGWSPQSAEEAFTTALAPPGAPEGLEAWLAPPTVGGADADSAHAVELRWLAPAPSPKQALVASYELHAVPIGPGHGHEVRKVVGKATSFCWEELQPGLRYHIRVRAAGMEGAGHGTWSEAVEIVMPGHSRGVTDSADSMSAASGTNDVVPASLASLSAASLSKVALDRGARKRTGKKAAARAQQAQKGRQNGSELNDDAMSTVSQAQSVRGGTSASGAATATLARNRVNAIKLAPVAVQKRPKASINLMRELRQLVAAPGQGLRRAQKAASKATSRFCSRFKWQILAVLWVAFLAWALQFMIARATKGPVIPPQSHTPQSHYPRPGVRF